MPRTPEQVQAEYDALREQGVHPATKQMRALRAEKRALEARNDDEAARKQAPQAEVHAEVGPGGICVSELAPDAGIALSGGVSDVKWHVVAPSDGEWEFIQKCIAELPIPLKGMTGQMFKQMYDRVSLQVRLWRQMREIHDKVGPGGEWPSFTSFGLRATDGRPDVKTPAPAPTNGLPEAPPPAPNVTEAQMPMRSKPSREELLSRLGGPAKFDPRPIPAGA